MVFILTASSLHHAIETFTPDEKERYNDKIYSIPSLSVSPTTKNLRKIVQNFFARDLEEKKKNSYLARHFE